jgi:hypothetical protein
MSAADLQNATTGELSRELYELTLQQGEISSKLASTPTSESTDATIAEAQQRAEKRLSNTAQAVLRATVQSAPDSRAFADVEAFALDVFITSDAFADALRRTLKVTPSDTLEPQRKAVADLQRRRDAIEAELAQRIEAADGAVWEVRATIVAGRAADQRWMRSGKTREVAACENAADAADAAWPDRIDGDHFVVCDPARVQDPLGGAVVDVIVQHGQAIECENRNGVIVYPGAR